jgi:transcription elongation GreA/GreB family factor
MTETQFSKSILLDQIITVLENAYQNAVEAANQARDTATNGENVAENKYDTLGLEAAYLAHGQSQRAIDLKTEIAAFKNLAPTHCSADDEIRIGSMVVLTDESDNEQHLLIGPGAGGLKLIHVGKEFLVITASAPLGKALLGCHLDDEIELAPAGKTKRFEIVHVL